MTANQERLNKFNDVIFKNFILVSAHKSDSIRMKTIEISKNMIHLYFILKEIQDEALREGESSD